MSDQEERDPYDKPAEVLLHDGDWTIEKLDKTKTSETAGSWGRSHNHHSLVKHRCKHKPRYRGLNQIVIYPDDTYLCWRCGAEVPEGMIAVWKFQNWKELGYGG